METMETTETNEIMSMNPAEIEMISTDEILKQIRLDLRSSLNTFNDPKKGIRIIANKTGIHEKTLKRILTEERRPTYLTVFRFYRFKLTARNDQEVMTNSPTIIAKYLEQCNPQTIDEKVTFTSEIDRELKTNSVFGEIYLLLGCGVVTLDEVQDRFGHYGVSILKKMEKLKMAKEMRTGIYELGTNICPLSSESVLFLGNHLSFNYASSDRGDMAGSNFHGLYVEGLSFEGLQQWLKIDQDAFKKKTDLLKDKRNLGNLKTFTYMVTDQMITGMKQ